MDNQEIFNPQCNLLYYLIKAADINNRIGYEIIEWDILSEVWNHVVKLKRICVSVDELCNIVAPCLKEARYEQTLVLGLFVGARFLTEWEAILEPLCIPSKDPKSTRTKGFCDLLLVVNGELNLLEFKMEKKDLSKAINEVSGYICIQETIEKRTVRGKSGDIIRVESLWSDQDTIKRFALAGDKNKGIIWKQIDPEISKTKHMEAKIVLFSK
jgi:hypothetical protein